jgi:hypothetical protein
MSVEEAIASLEDPTIRSFAELQSKDTLESMLRANPSHASLRDRLLELMARQVLPVCDAAGHSVTEMIYAELLQRFPTIVTNNHPEFWIRFNLNGAISHCLHGGELFGDDECANDINEIRDAPANSGPCAIRAAIEGGLDERCGLLKYSHIEQWESGENDPVFRFYVHWAVEA